jgi:hypothetical protein
MFKKLLLATAGIAMLAGSAPRVGAESSLDFTLVNKTGYGIKAVYVAPSSSKQWGESIIDEPLEDGQSVDVEFQPKAASIKKWDIMVSWEDEDDPDVYWTGAQLSDISKITLKYDRKTNTTSASTE